MKRAIFFAWLALLPVPVLADTAQDVVTGNGTAGPYSLSWKGIAGGTDTVQVGSVAQMRSLDYTVDENAGTIAFMRPLPQGSVASVRYDYDPHHAVRVQNAPVIPLAVDLARAGQNSLALSARLQTGAAQPQSGALTVGAQANVGGKTAGMNARISYAPALGGPEHVATSDASRTGLSMGAQAGQSVHVAANFAREGQNAADTTSAAPGTQTLSVRTDTAPTKQISAGAQWTQTAPMLNGDKTGLVTTQTGANVTLSPVASAQVAASLSTTDAPGTLSDTQAVSVSAKATPLRVLSLSADYTNTLQDGQQPIRRRGVGLSLSPFSSLSLSAGTAIREAGQSQFTLTSVGANVRPLRGIELSGLYRARTPSPTDINPADDLDTGQAKVSLSPLVGLRLSGTYAQNPDDGADFARRVARRGLALETGMGALNLSGGYDWTRTLDGTGSAASSLSVNMGLRLSALTQITGSYAQCVQGLDTSPVGTSLYTLGLAHTLGDRFCVSLSGTMQTPAGASALPVTPAYTAKASLGLKF